MSAQAARMLEGLGVTIWTSSIVTDVRTDGVAIGAEFIRTKNVLWAAGVQPSEINRNSGLELDRAGRIVVESDLTLKDHPDVLVLGDQAHFKGPGGNPLPGLCPVAIQQGKFAAENILREAGGKPRRPFKYLDKGIMATIGRGNAVVETAGLKFGGFVAWLAWLFVHIFYLIGFKNRLIVFIQWAWSYFTLSRGARLITNRTWRSHEKKT